MSDAKILITGATGMIGSHVVHALEKRGVAFQCMVRHPAGKAARELKSRDIAVVDGDFDKPEALTNALAGIERAFLLTNSSENTSLQQLAFVAAAKKAGVKHVVKLSQLAARADSPVRFLRHHAIVEDALRSSGLEWTFVRPNLILDAYLAFAESIRAGHLSAPIGDSKVSVVDVRDVADVVVAALCEVGHEGQVYTVTGPAALGHREIADAFGSVAGHDVKFEEANPDDFAGLLAKSGMQSWQAEGLVEHYAHYARGEAAEVSRDVERVTGQPPRSIGDFARAHAATFGSPKFGGTSTVRLHLDRVGAVNVTVDDRGLGRAFLLLHGGGGPSSVAAFAALRAEHARVITPTHPGFAGTERPEGLTTIEDLASLYLQLLEHLGAHDVTVVGNSVGGWIAAEMALRHRSRVKQLVLVDAVGIAVEGHPVANVFELTPEEKIQRSFHRPEAFPPKGPPDPADRETLSIYGGDMSDPDLRDRLKRIAIPTLVLWGESDRIVDVEYGRAYAAAIPNARFHLLVGAGHLPQVEAPAQLLRAMDDFASAPSATRRALLIGWHQNVPGPLPPKDVKAGFDAAKADLENDGYALDFCLLENNAGDDGKVERALESKPYDCVCIGAGVRVVPEHLLTFEKIVNTVHSLSPNSRICFNTNPSDTSQAVERQI